MSTATAEPAASPVRALLSRWYALHPSYRLVMRWGLIVTCAVVAFHETVGSVIRITRNEGIGGYVWVVPAAAVLVAIGVTRRHRSELPIHDRQTDIIVGTMGLVLAVLVQAVLVPRFATYFYLLRLDLVAMWLFVLSSSIVLFGLRPVIRFAWVWGLMFMVFSLPYYLSVVFLGGGKFAAGASTLIIAAIGTGIGVGRTFRRGFIGSAASWGVGFATLITIGLFFNSAPVWVYQQVPALTAISVVGLTMYFQARRGAPKRILDRKVEPLAAGQVWNGVPLVIAMTIVLTFVPLPADATASRLSATAPGRPVPGQPLVAPPDWISTGYENFGWVHRFYGGGSVLTRQRMTASVGDPRFDKYARPRTLVVDNIVTERPFTFEIYPMRVLYDLAEARISPAKRVELGFGVKGNMFSVVDDKLLITWNALTFGWGDTKLGQRVTIYAVDNHEPDAQFPRPSDSMVSTLRTLITMLFRGNAVLAEDAPRFKDGDLLTEFGRALVAAQFRAAEAP
ncbi:hypothetical protein [Mycolicibacterium holsaticum]|jgi:hypothetical protein|uniref:Uncharacterized protein n=1 Tax=Mycolicibacterium holsaticum TaxID=152142 RepID=A0A1E3RUM3_9MYCO|nr:hypothetical protein [Mycolicibacterium holsaticum]ODQ93538.1 hypothetical protein BHQ17_12820 [Mycolicibacterium holsaticum]